MALVGAAAVGVVILASAMAGKWHLEERHYGSFSGDPASPPPIPTTAQSSSTVPLPKQSENSVSLPFDAAWLLLPVVLSVAGLLVWLVVRLIKRYLRTAGAGEQDGALGGGVAAGEEQPELPPLLQAANTGLAALQQTLDPSDAIIAAWLAIERGAAESGVTRGPAQTATEFTVAVLARTPADPAATRELLGLYHRARFAAGGASATDVVAAIRCVQLLAAGWSELASVEAAGTTENAEALR